MHGIKDIIQEATTLPVEERVIVVDSLLRTLNPPDAEIDRAWARIAQRRLADLRSGRVQPVPGDQVFAKIKERFAR
ncbi:MAG: addiction module protein [Syntrophaceae bacterium]|nr:addiction module protein [Syntrophaceae bacterium]